MKTLEEVIKNKNRFTDGKKKKCGFWKSHIRHIVTGEPIYTVNNLDHKNIIELIQEAAPLIYFLISRFKNEEKNTLRELCIDLEFPPNDGALTFKRKFKINDENPLKLINEFIQDFEKGGCFLTFTRNFNFVILLISNEESEKESEEENEEESEEENEEENGEDEERRRITSLPRSPGLPWVIIINTEQTFKSNECVICISNSPNVLFCNYGHIPICEECDKTKSLTNCPICKTENTIKRIIN